MQYRLPSRSPKAVKQDGSSEVKKRLFASDSSTGAVSEAFVRPDYAHSRGFYSRRPPGAAPLSGKPIDVVGVASSAGLGSVTQTAADLLKVNMTKTGENASVVEKKKVLLVSIFPPWCPFNQQCTGVWSDILVVLQHDVQLSIFLSKLLTVSSSECWSS